METIPNNEGGFMAVTFDGDVVIVTGGAGALGRAYCKVLAGLGARVVVNDTGGVVDGSGGNPDAAAAVVREIEAEGGVAIADTGNGADAAAARTTVARAIDAFGRVDAVIANAGILRDTSFHKMTDEDFVAVLNVHLLGTFRIFHAAYPHLREQGYGRLIATTSAAGLFGNFGQTNYAAAKMAIVGLCKSLALEGAKADVKVNVIAPQAMSRMTESLMPPNFAELLSPARVAPLVAYLASRQCAVSGEIFSTGGGRIARVRTGLGNGVFTADLDPDYVDGSMHDLLDDEIVNYPANVMEEVGLLIKATGVGGA